MERMKPCSLLFLLSVLLLSWVHAKPPAEKLKPFKKKLSRTTRVDLDEDTLSRALYFFRKEVDIPIVIDFESLKNKLDRKVTITGEDISCQHILNWICRTTNIDYDIRDGIFYITTREKAVAPYLKTKVFDVRALTTMPMDMPGPNIELVSGEADISITSDFGAEGHMDTHSLREYIEHTVSPEIWTLKNTGINISSGTLVITAPGYVLGDVEQVLNTWREKGAKMVTIDSRILAVETNALDTFLEEHNKETLILSEKETEAFASFIQGNSHVKKLAASRTVCFNDQRIHVMATTQNAYIRDVTPVIADEQASVDPEIDTWTKGNVLDIRPTLSFDNNWIYLQLRSTLSHSDKSRTVNVPVGAYEYRQETNKAINKPTSPGNTSNKSVKGHAPVECPEVDIVRYRTSLRVPNCGSVLMSGHALDQKKIGMGDSEILLFLRVTFTQ